MTRLFISHSTQDIDFVRALRAALADHGHGGWIDSRELRGGDLLWPAIKAAIEASSGYAVVVSPAALQSEWVSDELTHALKVQKTRGRELFPVIPLSLDGTKLGAFKTFFKDEPLLIPASSQPGGIEEAMNALLVAVGKRLPADLPPAPQPNAEPLEELVLELTDLRFHEQGGVRRPCGRARLVYEPATAGQDRVHSAQRWQFVAPLGPIEADELRWYLEKYAIWPSVYFQARAEQVEKNLVGWGKLLHAAAMPAAHTANVTSAWEQAGARAGRRFSVHVDATLDAGSTEADIRSAKEAATLLLGLPWELLHDGARHLFQGAKPARVRRRLPATERFDVPVVAPPIRILLVTARPENTACSYIDHRVSALPLVEATEALPGLVELTVLNPPTLPALSAELDRARESARPYHVVHFDGHGVYDKTVGLGGLCFEKPEDVGKLNHRDHVVVHTDTLGPLLRDHRIPLVFLEACQSAQAEQASESVASELLKVGVASVVAMSHSVLVATAAQFVEAFYRALAAGKRVGDAMLAGQRRLKDDNLRGRAFGVGDLRIEDWFVPVLFQERDDPQLFRVVPSRQAQEDFRSALEARLGAVPPVPVTGFVGRSRELLALERLLRDERYAVLRGQGGEGKTTLAAEFARWVVRSHQIRRAAFVSVETHGNAVAVADALGKQLVAKDFTAAGDLENAIQQIERALREQATLLVMDNMESVLLPPYIETPEALSEEAGQELKDILALCERLLKLGDTRLVFTSREPLPAPFDAVRSRRELHQLAREDAVKLVERALSADGGAGATTDAARESIEELVNAVHCHARTLALLAPELRTRGVDATREALVELMAEMERKFPGSREQSLFASVELSLRRMSPTNRERARVLGVFHGGVSLVVLLTMTEWEEAEVGSLAGELIKTGLATPNQYNHLTLNPALCPYLRGRLETTEREALTARWAEAMEDHVNLLTQQQHQNTKMAATLMRLNLPNIFAYFHLVQRAGNVEATVNSAASLYALLRQLGEPRLLERMRQAHAAAATALNAVWSRARWQIMQNHIEHQLREGKFHAACKEADELLQRTRDAGEQAYTGADYDLAMTYALLARAMRRCGKAEPSLPLLDEARERFEVIAHQEGSRNAKGMVAVCVAEQGNCLIDLDRLDEAKSAFEESIRRAEQLNDVRAVAVGKIQLGTICEKQGLYPAALNAYAEAREQFKSINEPNTIAQIWYKIGIANNLAQLPVESEDAFRESLALFVRLDDVPGQAMALRSLGDLYTSLLQRLEEAVGFYRQALDKLAKFQDSVLEGQVRTNLANSLHKLGRLHEARQEINRAIECDALVGDAEPWKTWAILADIETDANNSGIAADARRKARDCYLAYRRNGGENHYADGRISIDLTRALLAGQRAAADALLNQFIADPGATALLPFLHALQATVAGSRDRALADSPGLDYAMSAEILILIETLEKAGK